MANEITSDEAYLLFVEEKKKTNIDLAELPSDEIEKILSDKWNSMTDEEKQKYGNADKEPENSRNNEIRDRSRSPHRREKVNNKDQNEEVVNDEVEVDEETEDEEVDVDDNDNDMEEEVHDEKNEIENKKQSEENGNNDKLKPPKRPLSNYMIYSSEMRIKLKDTMPSASIGQIQKEISKHWKELSEEDKQTYNKKAEEMKLQYDKELQEYKDKYGDIINNLNSNNNNSNGTIIQLARLKRLIMIDDDIKRITKDGLKTIAFSIEEFVKCLTDSSQKLARIHGRKTVAISDVYESIKANDRYEFLERDMKLLMNKCNANKNKNSEAASKEKKRIESEENTNSIMNFFK